ncbi:MAG: mechanosensitive ion channel protein [Leptolyngbya sp. SIO3F4]|nr:mechanosensitive ion channel protein [Leptolyngbya sp. SIO3F4]
MFILQSEQVDFCTLNSRIGEQTVQRPGIEYQRKLYTKGEIYDLQHRQAAIQKAKQKVLELKGQPMILVEDSGNITLWYHDKTAEKVSPLLTLDLEKLVAAMRNVGGIQIKERQFHLKTYHQCFVGNEAVDWLTYHLKISREDAVRIGQRLIDENWIHHVLDEQAFQDGYFFYRFRWDEQ